MSFMKIRKTILSFILVLTLTAGSVFALSACSNGSSNATFLVYYTNSSADDIIYREVTFPDLADASEEKVIDLLFKEMFSEDLDDDQYHSVKPADVELNGYKIEDGLMTIDFSNTYLLMSNVREIIFRSAIVLTMIQVSGITGVQFTVNGSPLTNSKGEEIGVMTADQFVNVLLNEEGMLKQSTDLTVYFANEDGTALVPIVYHFTIDNKNQSLEEYIVAKIIEGPAEGESAYPTISSAVELLSVFTSDRVCYVNLSSSFLEQENQPVSDEMMVYSIVNSLCNLSYVSSVQFLVDGDPNVTLHKTLDLTKPLTRNHALVEQDDAAN